MATDVLTRSSVSNCNKRPIIDCRIERMLWHLEDDAKRNVIEELIFELDLDELLEARETIFEEVTTGTEGQDGAETSTSLSGHGMDTPFPRISRPISIPWKMIKRRVPSIAADDLCELYLYRLDLI